MIDSNLLDYGLIGIILLSFIGSSIVPLPMVPVEALVAAGYFMGINIWVLYTAIVLSSSLGGYTTYIIGSTGSKLIGRFDKKKIENTKKHLDRWGSIYVIVSSCIFIIPYDIVALCCGILKMNRMKFFVATVIGKIIRIGVVFGILILGWA